jgi:hypothetical protein
VMVNDFELTVRLMGRARGTEAILLYLVTRW